MENSINRRYNACASKRGDNIDIIIFLILSGVLVFMFLHRSRTKFEKAEKMIADTRANKLAPLQKFDQAFSERDFLIFVKNSFKEEILDKISPGGFVINACVVSFVVKGRVERMEAYVTGETAGKRIGGQIYFTRERREDIGLLKDSSVSCDACGAPVLLDSGTPCPYCGQVRDAYLSSWAYESFEHGDA